MALFPKLLTFRKDTPTFKFTVKNSDDSPFNMTAAGSVVKFTAKSDIADLDGAAIFSKNCTITDAANGKCEVTLDQADTTFTGDVDKIYAVELEFTNTAARVITLGQTELIIKKDVLQAT